MGSSVWGLLALGPILLSAACGLESIAWQGIEDPVDRTFEVSPGGQLTVESDLGSIEVRTWNENRVDVHIMRAANTSDPARANEILKDIQIDMNQSANSVDVRVRTPGGWWNRGRNMRLEFQITVPQSFNVDLRTSGGGITVTDLEGKVNSRTSGGGLHFGRIQGPVFGRTSGGGIELQACTGTVDVETSGGGIQIGDVDGDVTAMTSGGPITIQRARGNVKAGTSGGGIRVDEVQGMLDASTSGGGITATISEQPQGDCRLETSGGSIKVRLAENVAVDLDAKTSGGRVRTDFPVTSPVEIKKDSIRGPLNGGGPALILRTSGGGIEVDRM
ncbi:MAG TPA: hypothetical protein PLP42_10000 [Acidobacteriota bacterium]|nr:hypothetical protein [Acidobacteriota bacterium]